MARAENTSFTSGRPFVGHRTMKLKKDEKLANLESVLAIAAEGFATLVWPGGEKILMDSLTANALKAVHDALRDDLKPKFAATIERSPGHLLKVVDFAWANVGFKS